MEHLPWIVVYGQWVWVGALLVAVLGAAVWTWWRPRHRARREARLTQQRLREHAGRLDVANAGERIVLTGRLEVDGPCVRLRDGAACAVTTVVEEPSTLARPEASRRADRLVLVVGEERVPLVGRATVRVGSDEAWLRSRLGSASKRVRSRVVETESDELLAYLAPHSGPVVLRSVAAGDAVHVEGELQQEAVADTGGYRDAASRFRLDGPLAVAFVGAPAVSGPAPRRYVRAAALGALAWLAVFGAGGAAIHDRAGPERPFSRARLQPVDIDRQVPLTLAAAATPFHRDEALSMLESAYRYSAAPGRELIERVVALHDLRGACEPAVFFLVEHGQLQDAAQRGRACKAPGAVELTVHALLGLGEFEEASEFLGQHASEDFSDIERKGAVQAHLLAGQLERAAAALRDNLAYYDEERGKAATCLIDALEARAGDTAALARLRAEVDDDPWCRLLLADLLPADERAAVLEPVFAESLRAARPAHLLLAEAAAAGGRLDALPVQDPWELHAWTQLELSSFQFAGQPGLERPVADALANESEPTDAVRQLRAALAVQEAKRAVVSGDPASMAHAARALSDLEGPADRADADDAAAPGDVHRLANVRALQALTDVFAGDESRAKARLAGVPASFSVTELLALLDELETGLPSVRAGYLLDDVPQEVLAAVVAGDGAPLGRWMNDQVYRMALDAAVYLAPQVETGRDAILDYLAHARRFTYLGINIDERLAMVARRRLIAAALGASELAAAEAEIARRYLEAMSRRETAVPLMVFEQL